MNNIILTQLSQDELQTLIECSLSRVLAKSEIATSTLEQDKIFTIEEAASFLSLSRHTIYDLTSRSAIPYLKKGRRLYFSKEDLISWLKDSRRATKAEADQEADSYLAGIKKGGK